jgi:hypothetical protein
VFLLSANMKRFRTSPRHHGLLPRRSHPVLESILTKCPRSELD